MTYYSGYLPFDLLNGTGVRNTIFFSGCEHYCKGCFSKKTWSFTNGKPYTSEIENRIISDLNNAEKPLDGLSILGGEPLHPRNIETVIKLCERVKNECQDKNIWLWTGYELSNFTTNQKRILSLVDVIVDGKFIQEKASKKLKFRGSSNQIIHVLNV